MQVNDRHLPFGTGTLDHDRMEGICSLAGMQASFAGLTDPGRVRHCNEDNLLLLPQAGMFAVADGLGGLDAGDLASSTALAHLRNCCLLEEGNTTDPIRRLQFMIAAVNRHTYERRIALGKNMATTLALVHFVDQAALLGHVGDSRIYRWRNRSLTQLTQDHSLVNSLCEQGALTVSQAQHSPQRHIITRAVGAEPTVQPGITSLTVAPGDVLLLCTDGLTAMVNDEMITTVITAEAGDVGRMVERLVSLANEAGGSDNITVVAVAFTRAEQKG